MAAKSKTNKDTQNAADQSFIGGLQKHQAEVASLMVGGVSIPTTSLITTLQSRIAARTQSATSQKAWQDDVQAEQATLAKSKAEVSGARQAIKVMFAGQIEALGDFGIKPPKPRTPLTTAQKAAAAAKAKATRAARHTMGSKQKAAITGTTPAPVETPSAEPGTAPAAASPAPAAPSASKS
jgi:hypothetical protein